MFQDGQQLTLFSLADHQMPLPDYQVRESARARHVSLKVSFQGALEVVVPTGFDQAEIPEILDRRRDWIAKTLKRIERQRDTLPVEHLAEKPTALELRSRQETWAIHYTDQPGRTLTLTQSGPQALTLAGAVSGGRGRARVVAGLATTQSAGRAIPLAANPESKVRPGLQPPISAGANHPLGQLFLKAGHQPQLQAVVFAAVDGGLRADPRAVPHGPHEPFPRFLGAGAAVLPRERSR
jgi:hypothetical protein